MRWKPAGRFGHSRATHARVNVRTVGSGDRTIRLWDLNAGAETARLEGHSDWVTTLCALPDGRLASGSEDRTIRLWDVKTGAQTARLETDAPITCVLALSTIHLVAADRLGRLHWLEVVD
jgi:WD40 repeat protein